MFKTALFIVVCFVLCPPPARADDITRDAVDAYRAGEICLRRFMLPDALDNYHKAMRLSAAIHNDKLYAQSVFGLGQAIWYSSNFAAAADTTKLALQLFKNLHDDYNTGRALRVLSNIYDDEGDYENAFRAVREALELLEGGDKQNWILSLVQMGRLYKDIGDYPTALQYYQQAEREQPQRGEYEYREMNHRMGELYIALNKPDSAEYYYHNAITGNRNSKIIRLRMGELCLLQNRPDSARHFFEPLYDEAIRTNDINQQIPIMLALGKISFAEKDLTAALAMAKGAFELSSQHGARQTNRDASQLLSSIYEAQGDAVKALQYMKRAQAIKDSAISDQFKGQLYLFKQVAADKYIRDARKQALYIVLGVCLAGVLLFFIVTLRHKNEKLRLKQHAAELEMQALRAQMNPHFIFNCLSAINHFILNRDTDRASEYLTRFSRLIRMVLVNAGKSTIPLEDELAMLKLYLNMEQLRFKDAFDYYIYFDASVKPSMISIPSFILQPFCENAIWHGLLHKEGRGQLNIYFKIEDGVLICTIRDNGIGMEKAAEIKTQSAEKRASFGHKLGAERLALFNRESDAGASFTIEDAKDEAGSTAGTIVTLKIKNKALYD